MNEYTKRRIVTHAWHEFLYGYNGEERAKDLQDMCEMFPVSFDNTGAVAVYISDYSLPVVEDRVKCDPYQEKIIASEHLSLTILIAILNKSVKDIGIDELNERMSKFLERISSLFLEDRVVVDIEELLEVLVRAREFYSSEYVKMVQTGKFQGNINDSGIKFMELIMFIENYKRALGMRGHFSVVIDQQQVGTVVSQKAVNTIINRRCCGDITMKVAVEPGEWKSYYGFNGQLAESVHDYSTVELDNSLYEHVKKLRLKNDNK